MVQKLPSYSITPSVGFTTAYGPASVFLLAHFSVECYSEHVGSYFNSVDKNISAVGIAEKKEL